MGPTGPRILLVDDQRQDLELASVLLQKELTPAKLHLAADALSYAAALSDDPFDLVVSERRPAWADGAGVIPALRRCFPEAALILFSRDTDPADDLAAARLGLDYVLGKSSAGFLQLPLTAQRLLAVRAGGDGEQMPSALLQRLPAGLFELDPETQVVSCLNPACRRLLGLDERPSAAPPRLPDLLAAGPERDRLQRALEHGEPLSELDAPLDAGANASPWLRITLWPAAQGAGSGFEGLLWDVTDWRRRLRKLTGKSARLTRSNADLERFAYVVSHDLQQPLGYISRYASLLKDGYLNQLDNDARRYLKRIIDASDRLQLMVDDVLAYSRVSSRGGEFEVVDFENLADAAAGELEALFAETGASYRREPLPQLEADAAQIQQLFTNLFANALKFRGSRPPEIRVSVKRERDHWRFCVADNGIGVRPADQERIFEMFQRLHGEDEYPGTGIGLAICRGIVERHGGSIWVDSEPGAGSRFFFTIPASQSSKPESVDVR
jgi:signal transduction histidine kinase